SSLRLIRDRKPGREAARNARYAAARMRPRATEIEPLERGPHARKPRRGAEHQKLVGPHFAMVPATARKAELPFDIGGKQKLARHDALPEIGGMDRQSVDDAPEQTVALSGPAAPDFIRHILHEDRHDMLPGRRKRGIVDARQRYLHRRLERDLA